MGLFTANVTHAGDSLAQEFAAPPASARPNRLIRDSGLPEKERLTWSTWNPYMPTDPVLPSGLLGPVRLMSAE